MKCRLVAEKIRSGIDSMQSRFHRPNSYRSSWQSYQSRLKRNAAKKRLKKEFRRYMPIVPLILLAVFGVVSAVDYLVDLRVPNDTGSTAEMDAGSTAKASAVINKEEIQDILSHTVLKNLEDDAFDIQLDGHAYRVDTSLDIGLQQFLLKKMDRHYSRSIAIVVMDPVSGKVLSLAGFDSGNENSNPCIDTQFPAASIFKIVTAAAGIEKCGFRPSSRFAFNGGKYTLYKSQLKDRVNKYTNWMTLKDSFAQSVNPVFGKIGANYLGRGPLEHYAHAFGFNQPLDFEVPLEPSVVSLSDDSYQWAEIACGFNRETLMTPLHGVVLSSVILNKGMLVQPTVIDKITDEDGGIQYRSEQKTAKNVISADASKIIKQLMKATIRSGTSRKAFRGHRRDRILSKLEIGGKTGSISSKERNDVRYDWFVGFAEEKGGHGKLAVSVIVAHEKYIGKRAGYYARIAMKQYFKNYFKQREAASRSGKESDPNLG